MTLAELRDKANAKLTPLWGSVQRLQTKYYQNHGTYKDIPIRKLNIENSERFDVWGRVVADATGYSMQVLVVDEATGDQYARAQGEGTGTTFAWKKVSVGTLPSLPESGLPNSMHVEDDYEITPAHEQKHPETGEITQVPEVRRVVSRTFITF
jgi:hypothetical protein